MKKMKCCGNCKNVTMERDKLNRLRRKCKLLKVGDKFKQVDIRHFCWQYEED